MSKTTMSSVCRRLHGLFKTVPSTTKFAAAKTRSSTEKTTTSKPEKSEKKLHNMVKKFKKSSVSSKFRSRHDIYTKTVQRLARHKRFSMIQEILDFQKNFHDITNEPFASRVISLYGKVGMVDQARKLFDEMPELNCPRTVYSFNALLSACIDAGRFHEIEQLFNNLPEKLGISLDAVSYNIVIKGLCKMGALDSAALMLDDMVAEGVNPNSITFNTLLFEFYKNGKFMDGERIWNRMVEMNVVPNITSYNAKLLGLASEKRLKEAIELVEEMGSKEIEPNLFSFNALIKGFVNDDNLEEAKRWYGEIQKNNFTPNKMTSETIIPFACEKGDLDFAFQACEEILSRKSEYPVDAKVLQVVVDKLVKKSRIDEAKKMVQLGKTNKYTLKLP